MKEPLRCRPPATATVQVDTADLVVTRWDFPPGAETGWHRHGYSYVVVPVTDGKMLVELKDGTTNSVDMVLGQSYARPPGMEHNVVNGGDTPFSFVEIELKAYPG